MSGEWGGETRAFEGLVAVFFIVGCVGGEVVERACGGMVVGGVVVVIITGCSSFTSGGFVHDGCGLDRLGIWTVIR